jgi:hypothetical protein
VLLTGSADLGRPQGPGDLKGLSGAPVLHRAPVAIMRSGGHCPSPRRRQVRAAHPNGSRPRRGGAWNQARIGTCLMVPARRPGLEVTREPRAGRCPEAAVGVDEGSGQPRDGMQQIVLGADGDLVRLPGSDVRADDHLAFGADLVADPAEAYLADIQHAAGGDAAPLGPAVLRRSSPWPASPAAAVSTYCRDGDENASSRKEVWAVASPPSLELPSI